MLKKILFLLNLADALRGIAVAPNNTVSRVGEKFFLKCGTNDESKVRKWTHYSTNRSTVSIYKHPDVFHPNFTHFDIQVDINGSEVLYTNSTRSEDAGIYGCSTKVDGKDETFTAHVVVLDSLPVCESNLTKNYSYSLIEGDHIFMQCNINFRGFWAPSIKWTQHGGDSKPDGKPIADVIEKLHNPSQSITSKLTIAVNSSTNCSYYSCRIYFAKYDGTGVTTSKNVPDFNYTWNSSVIYVSPSSAESNFAETDAGASSAVSSSTEKSSSPVDWYLVSLSMAAGMSIFFILLVVLAIAGCIRFKKKVSDHYASTNKETIEMPTQESAYDIIHYATSDNYETIGDEDRDPSVVLSVRPRLGPLPTPGYAGLMPVQPSAPAVYSRMESYATPEDIDSDSTLKNVTVAIEHVPEKQIDELKTGKTESQSRELHRRAPTYLEVRE